VEDRFMEWFHTRSTKWT